MNNTDNKLQFKTNINCSGCINTVKPFLDDIEGIAAWEVDTTNRDKILTVQTDGATEADVIEAVEKAGYKISRSDN